MSGPDWRKQFAGVRLSLPARDSAGRHCGLLIIVVSRNVDLSSVHTTHRAANMVHVDPHTVKIIPQAAKRFMAAPKYAVVGRVLQDPAKFDNKVGVSRAGR